MIKLAEMRAFSFGVARLKHANFLCETKSLCRFSGVEAVFALEIPMSGVPWHQLEKCIKSTII